MQRSVRRSFAELVNKGFFNKPALDRVMTTGQWPVPYYTRIMKAVPHAVSYIPTLVAKDNKMSDIYWFYTRKQLQKTEEGRNILHNVEFNVPTNKRAFKLEDVAKQSKSYVFELSQYIDIAHKENKRILNKTNLL